MRHLLFLFSVIIVFILVTGCKEEVVTVPSASPLTTEDTTFVTIPAGSFVNSSGETIEMESFQLQKTEVNNRLYRYLADIATLSYPADPAFISLENYFYEYPEYPVVNISANSAEIAASVMGARLPTRNEWEYAASLGLTGDISEQFPWGELSATEVSGVPANYMALDNWEERDLDGFLYTAPVGSYPLSNAGLADLSGNVSEMVFHPADTTIHLVGGSWLNIEEVMTIGYHREVLSGDISWFVGFRLAR